MLLHKGQVFRFLGKDAARRALVTAVELQGACIRRGNELQMIEDRVVHFGRPGFFVNERPQLEAADYIGETRHRTSSAGKNGSFNR